MKFLNEYGGREIHASIHVTVLKYTIRPKVSGDLITEHPICINIAVKGSQLYNSLHSSEKAFN